MSDSNNPQSSRPMTLRQQLEDALIDLHEKNDCNDCDVVINEALDVVDSYGQEIAREAALKLIDTMIAEIPVMEQWTEADLKAMRKAYSKELTQKPPQEG